MPKEFAIIYALKSGFLVSVYCSIGVAKCCCCTDFCWFHSSQPYFPLKNSDRLISDKLITSIHQQTYLHYLVSRKENWPGKV